MYFNNYHQHCARGDILSKDGFDLRVETFLSLNGNMIPCFEIIVSGDTQTESDISMLKKVIDNVGINPDTISITESDILSMLKKLKGYTGVDPEAIFFDDEQVMSLFTSTNALGIKPDDIGGISIGTIGVHEFGSYHGIRNIIEKVRPQKFSDLIRVLGLAHGADVWNDNTDNLIDNGYIQLFECISNRDDIMTYLEKKGLNRNEAFGIMQYVRMGRGRNGIKDEWKDSMKANGVPDWYLDSCEKISYLMSKANLAVYAVISWRLLYYKLYYPEAFYRVWMEHNAEIKEEGLIEKGYEFAKEQFEELRNMDREKMGQHEIEMLDIMSVIMEIHAREIKL